MKLSNLSALALLLVVIISSFDLRGQTHKKDSLEEVLRISKQDTSKVNLLNRLSVEVIYSEPERSIAYSKEAIAISNNLGYNRGLGAAYYALGRVYTTQGDFDLAETNLNKSLEIHRTAGETKKSFSNL